MTSRLKSGFWVRALMRRASVEGAQAFLTRKGDEDAGAVLIILNGMAGHSRLLTAATGPDGSRRWLMVSGPEPKTDQEIGVDVARFISRDPDLWVVEIEDRAYRAFVDEPIEIVGVSPAGSARAVGQNPGPNYPGPHR